MKQKVVSAIAEHLQLSKKEIEKLIEIPPSEELGDYAFPTFSSAKLLKKAPNQIAQSLVEKIKSKYFEKVEAKGPYINFFVDKKHFASEILKQALKKNFGSTNKKGKIALEHTSLNPNASPHVGRARNSIIGDSIKRILEFQGYEVETYYYVNDVSKQVAMLALEFKGSESFSDLLNLYIKINKKISSSPELEKKVFEMLKKFESQDKQTLSLFKKIVSIALKGQTKILKEFGIEFDKFDYESSHIKSSPLLLKRFEKTGKLFKDENGRFILDESGFGLEEKMRSPMLVLARSNGTGLYVLRDLAYTIDKLKRCKQTFIVLGEDQKLYFEQLKIALNLLGESAPTPIHYSYVLIQDEDKIGKMSTRKGDVVLLEDFMSEARKKAEREIKKRKTSGDAKKIGYGAVKYTMLKNNSNKNIIFNWEQALNFEGNSGPYVQYAYARASSILAKASSSKSKALPAPNKNEISLLKKISDFPLVVEKAEAQLDPSIIAHYSFELAQKFNEFYHSSQVIGSKEEYFRLKITKAFSQTLKNSLNLLGIEAIEKM